MTTAQAISFSFQETHKIADAEKLAIKRIIRKRDNADKVIAEIENLLSQTTQDNQLMLNGTL